MNYSEILEQSIDLHVHVGPEIIPRRFGIDELKRYEQGKLAGIAVKNHFFPTVAMGNQKEAIDDKPFIIQSVVLNRYVGGFNPYIVRASAELACRPVIVWFPTLHTAKFQEGQTAEIPAEWIGDKVGEVGRRTVSVPALAIFDDKGALTSDVREVLQAIKETNAILATGHLSWQDSQALIRIAVAEFDISRIIVTHPLYQRIAMPISVQKELADLGAVMEHCYSMYSIDKVAMSRIAEEIKAVGSENCILSSDVGQAFSLSPSEALLDFMNLLGQEGVGERELYRMLVDNPARLIGPDR